MLAHAHLCTSPRTFAHTSLTPGGRRRPLSISNGGGGAGRWVQFGWQREKAIAIIEEKATAQVGGNSQQRTLDVPVLSGRWHGLSFAA